MEKLRVGVIGQGRSGYGIHVLAFSQLTERYQVVAVCDPIRDRTREAAESLGAERHEDWRALVDRRDLDLVVVAPPSHLHVPVTRAVLEAGHNALCDKPAARRAADVDALIELADRRKLLYAVFQQSRFGPYFRKVKEIITSGVLGRVAQIKISFNGFGRRWDWQTVQAFDAGSLLNTGPHPLDQALDLLGHEGMPQVTCHMDRVTTFGDAEDFVKILLRSPGKPLVDLEISSCDPYPRYSYHVQGEYGGLTGDMNTLQWKCYRPAEAPRQTLTLEPLEGRVWCREDLALHEETWTNPHPDLFEHMAREFYTNLHDALTKGAPLVVTAKQVRRQIAVIEECHRQNPLSRRVQTPTRA